jgi:GT2 family glycosyltransferase
LKTLAIIVNYETSDLALGAVGSVLGSASSGPVDVVVVDNSEDSAEAEALRSKLPSTTHLLVSPKNIGFGRACNRAFQQFPAEYILLLNPDARLLPGCLERLQKTLSSSRRMGAVAPHVFWDDGCTFSLPPSYPPSLMFLAPVLASWGPRAPINVLLSGIWRRYAVKVWRSHRPVGARNLSGGLVLLKREAVLNAGGLFDPRFFLYFEDTDLFLRLRKSGYKLVLEPRARAIHYYDQCGRQDREVKRAHMVRSHRIFLQKHGKGWKSWLDTLPGGLKNLIKPDGGGLEEPEFTSPFVLEVSPQLRRGWLFEWSPNPDLVPAVGRFGQGLFLDFPAECWAMLAPGRYFGRLGSPRGFGLNAQRFSWEVQG